MNEPYVRRRITKTKKNILKIKKKQLSVVLFKNSYCTIQ